MLLEMYPDQELYFLARDSELIHDLVKWLSRDDPRRSSRLHLLNISRGNMDAENVKAYLAQEGISEASLGAGKKILLVDTGFSGTIPKVLQSYFPASLRPQFQTHLMCSENPGIPSSRAFLTGINPAAVDLDPAEMQGSIISYEHLPRWTDRSTQFASVGGKWQPLSRIRREVDGIVNPELAKKYMEDLLFEAEKPSSKELLVTRRAQWAKVRETAREGDAGRLRQELRALLAAHRAPNPDSRFIEAMVRDVVDMAQKKQLPGAKAIALTVEELGLTPVKAGLRATKMELIEKYPEWAHVLQNPETEIEALVKNGEFGKLGAITDVVNDHEFFTILTRSLAKHASQKGVREYIQMLIEKDDQGILRFLASNTFSRSETAGMADLLRLLIEKGDSETLQTLARETFTKRHTARMSDLLRLMIERGDQEVKRTIASVTFSQPHTAGMKDLVRLLLEEESPVILAPLRKSLSFYHWDDPILQAAAQMDDPSARFTYLREHLGPAVKSKTASSPASCAVQFQSLAQ